MNRIPESIESLVVLSLCAFLAACGSRGDSSEAVAESREEHVHGEDGDHADAHGHEEGGQHVKLSDAQIAAAGLTLAQVGPAEVRDVLPLFGVIVPNAERMREVAARFPGVVQTVASRVGDPVRRGETLATVESNESLSTYAITAPLSGVVTDRQVNPGEQTGEKTLFTVADLSTVWVELSLFPRDVSKVAVGQPARVMNPDTGDVAEGRVTYIVPFGRAANQTQTARVLLENDARHWAPGRYVTADILLARARVPLAVRSEAIQVLERANVVFVRAAEWFEARHVSLGRDDGEYVEVLAGLVAGETYVASNSFILKAELGKGEAEHSH